MRSFFYRCVKNMMWIYVCATLVLSFELLSSEVPDEIYVKEYEQADSCLDFPFVVRSISSEQGNTAKRLCSILGIIPVKEVTVSLVDEQKVYAIGEIIGIYTECDGGFVVDTCEIETSDGDLVNPAKNLLLAGDYIKAVDGKAVQYKEDLVKAVETSNGEALSITFLRNKKEHTVKITP